jgi:hypothetical protein
MGFVQSAPDGFRGLDDVWGGDDVLLKRVFSHEGVWLRGGVYRSSNADPVRRVCQCDSTEAAARAAEAEEVTCERIPGSWRLAAECSRCREPITGDVHTDWKALYCAACCRCNAGHLTGEVKTIQGEQESLF